VDFLLTAKCDRRAASRFLRKSIEQCGTPAKITIDKSRANAAAIEDYNRDLNTSIELRQVKYLNNIVEQDHRAIKQSLVDYCRNTERVLALNLLFIPLDEQIFKDGVWRTPGCGSSHQRLYDRVIDAIPRSSERAITESCGSDAGMKKAAYPSA